jgi:methionine synthase II (cobalamin-independent)
MIQGWKEDKLNTMTIDELLDKYIKLYNDCISKVPEDMHVGVHLCRGTSASLSVKMFVAVYSSD